MLQVRDPNVLGNLGILNLKMPANGFFYVYTNNESNVKVYFNDLTILHTSSVLKEENHFYPYGLLMEGITPVVAANGSINKYKFSDSELHLELGLNQYDFSARFYDPVIGRFNVIDPFADFAASFTSYRYAFDNPVSIIDPSGLREEEYDEARDDGNCDPRDVCNGHLLAEVTITAYRIESPNFLDDLYDFGMRVDDFLDFSKDYQEKADFLLGPGDHTDFHGLMYGGNQDWNNSIYGEPDANTDGNLLGGGLSIERNYVLTEAGAGSKEIYEAAEAFDKLVDYIQDRVEGIKEVIIDANELKEDDKLHEGDYLGTWHEEDGDTFPVFYRPK